MILKNITNILSGFAFDSQRFNDKGNGMPLVRIRDVGKDKSETYYLGAFSDTYLLHNGDFIIGMDGNFRIAEWGGGEALLNQRVCKITTDKNQLNERYLFHFLPTALKKIEDSTPFATVKHLSIDKIYAIDIPLPSLSEQRRIAEILDHADAIRRKNREILEKYNQLAQSVFLEMFGDPTKNSMNWETKRFGDNIIDIVAGKSVGGDERKILEGELGVLKISSVTSGVFNSTEYKVIKKDTIKGPIITPKKGDLLFSRANTREMVGATCIVDKTYSNLFLPDKLWRIDLDGNKFQNSYIKYLLSHEGFRNNLRKVATGTSGSMLNISKQKLRDLSVPVPPIDLQRKFGNIIKSIEDSKQNIQQCFDKSEDLFQSLLQRAFRGEL